MPEKGPQRATDNPGGYPHDPVSTLVLMGDAVQQQAALRRKASLQHLNSVLNEGVTFKGAQSYLLGEDFAEKARCKFKAATALKQYNI